MITVRAYRSLLNLANPRVREVSWTGQTYRQLVDACRPREWAANVRVRVHVNGKVLGDDELDRVAADDVTVAFAPRLAGLETILIVAALVLTAASIAYQLLTQVTLRPPAERGDNASQTYAWDGVTTEYRPGFPVPIVYGEHDVGGQVVYMFVRPTMTWSGGPTPEPIFREYLHIVLALAEGRCESIGGVTGGDIGELDGAGGFADQAGSPGPSIPADIRINGNVIDHQTALPGVLAFLRMGEVSQSALPASHFPGASTIEQAGHDLLDTGASATETLNTTLEIGSVTVTLTFPSGLYGLDPGGNRQGFTVGVGVEWRFPGQSWQNGTGANITIPQGTLSSFSQALTFEPSASVQRTVFGPIEVRVRRLTPQGGTSVVSHMVWRQVSYSLPHTFAYPRTSLLGLVIQATDKIAGGRPNFQVRMRGKRVRVWDETHGLSTKRYWFTPDAGDTFNGIWAYPPGKNPAWILADFLTSPEGLGAQFKDANIDWPKFRDWADYCDESVAHGAGAEARFECDFVIDQQQPAWDVAMRIVRTGRAVPLIEGNKVTVNYEYADAHGKGTNSVPEKVRKRAVTAASVRDFKVEYLNHTQRPAVLVYQILNRDKDYAHDPVPVEDPDGGFNDPRTVNPLPFVKQTIEFFGVTRASQARREGLMTHKLNRLVRSKVTFRIGLEGLDLSIGDVIGVSHDAFRPYDTESFGYRMADDSNGDEIFLDHDVTLAAATTYGAIVVQADGSVENATVTSTAGSYPAGTAIELDRTVDCKRGSAVAFGVSGKIVKDYVIAKTQLGEDLTQAVEALEWQPSVYEDANVGEDLIDEGEALLLLPQSSTFSQAAESVESITVRRVTGGRTLIGWDSADGARGRLARVYAREADGSWFVLGESATPSIEVSALPFGRSYEIAVATTDASGTFQAPGEAAQVAYVGEEWPWATRPLQVHGVTSTHTDAGIRIRWEPLVVPGVVYEVRSGTAWVGSPTLYRGPQPWALLRDPPAGDASFLVGVQNPAGLFGEIVTVQSEAWVPPGSVAVLEVDELLDGTAGTHDRTTQAAAGDPIMLATGEVEGIYTSRELDPGFEEDTNAWWGVHAETAQLDDVSIGEVADLPIGSGEALWRRLGAREASLYAPGISWDLTIGDVMDVQVGGLPDFVGGRWAGTAGSHTRALFESRFFTASAWTPWLPHENGWRTATKMHVRVRLGRDSLQREAVVERMQMMARVGA